MQVASTHFSTTLSSQNQPHTIALHLDFLRRTQSGNAKFTVKDTKLGRQTSIIHVTLTQEGREEVVGYLTNSNMISESGVSFNTGYTLNPPPLPVDFSLMELDKDENWAPIPEMPFSAFRRATRKSDFYFPRQGQRKRSSADEWIRLANGTEKWTNTSIGYVCDMWPMPVEAFLHEQNPYDVSTISSGKEELKPARFWYPTLLLNLDVKKALPEEGVEWLFVRVEAKQIKNGRMDLEVVILDEGGELVALSHHVAFALGAERNTAKRKTEGSKI
jgi:Acyl-CoA thioesterase C-terminal domain/Acyl-CoA thioesterase N-terminal domain